ncbi:biopolymer transporter ExbD [Rhodobacteraceae bacterium 2376]|uniref:Biopolymer transporter ExbD n=1 Tax=Rhabdonatronobacter sediminivivens TaxID=2743469 RepID=A0A7Z0KZ74_9RHOB|nr:biopolymer transporter ExbD [Rhabdonatronobacter sediminivivens]NYS24128.1 biopolymer transporter ExbD [Rhabdonatronobacter sediminivivens]
MFRLANPRPARRPSLTPMIDVVFLLLVFFMLAARFGADAGIALSPGAGGGATYEGPPRLVEFGAEGALWLNGVETPAQALPDALTALMPAPDAPVILRPRKGADVQALADVTALLQGAGIAQLVVMEP